ncbi:MAG: ABC transporter substrate-binding protein [Stackebrandtia sp.]
MSISTSPPPLRRKALAAAAAVGLLALVAQAPAPVPAHADGPTQLVVAEDRSIDHLNPLNSFFAVSGELNSLMYTPLVRWGAEDYSPVEGLAVDWTSTKDQLEWTYTLRDDVEWTDGEPVTAHDAAFTFNLMLDDEELYNINLDLMKHFESVEAASDTELTIKLKSPTSVMSVLDTPIIPQHVWEDVEDPASFDNTDLDEFVGSGPFVPTEFKPDELIRFEVNDNYFDDRISVADDGDYWQGKPVYDELIFDYYKTSEAAVQALQDGEVDLVGGLNAQQYEALQGSDGIEVNAAPGRRTSAITFNVGAEARNGDEIGDGHPALQDPAVRQAIHHAIDKNYLIEQVEAGLAEPGVSYVPPVFDDFYWDPGGDTVPFDVDEGNRILDEAGYEKGDDGVRVSPDGDKLSFRLLYHSDREDYGLIQEYLVDWVAELGIELKPESARSDALNDQLYAGEYDVIFSGWTVGPDPTPILALYTCETLPADAEDSEARNTDTFYCDDDYDALHEQQRAETDPVKRADLVAQMQEMLYVDAPHVTLYYADSLEAYNSDRWEGFKTQPGDSGAIRAQEGVWGYMSAVPVGGEDEGGISTAAWLGIGAAAVLLAAVATFLAMRRRAVADERE